MAYIDLRAFIDRLSAVGELREIHVPVSPAFEMTEISRRVLEKEGPALMFKQPIGHHIPVITNLFGSINSIAMAMGCDDLSGLRKIGEFLSVKGL